MRNRSRALLAATWFATIGGIAHAQAPSNELKIGYYPGAMQTILSWVADAKGFYASHGIKYELIPVASGPLMSSNVANGAIDIGYNSPFNLGVGRKQGLEQMAIAGNMSMMVVLVARPDLPLPHAGKYPEVLRDLKGLNWGTYGRGSDTEELARIMVKDAGMDPNKDVTWIGIGPPNTGLPALKAGRVDVYVTTPPAPEFATAMGYGKIVIDTRKGEGLKAFKGVVYNSVLALAATVKNRPDILKKFVDAQSEAFCWAKNPANFDNLVAVIKAKMPLADLTDAQYQDAITKALAILTMKFPVSTLDPWNDLMLKAGVLTTPMPTDVVWKGAPPTDPKCQ